MRHIGGGIKREDIKRKKRGVKILGAGLRVLSGQI